MGSALFLLVHFAENMETGRMPVLHLIYDIRRILFRGKSLTMPALQSANFRQIKIP